MFAESLIFVASACSNGQCPPPASVASTQYIQVQTVQAIQTRFITQPAMPYFMLRERWGKTKTLPVRIGMGPYRICTSGACK